MRLPPICLVHADGKHVFDDPQGLHGRCACQRFQSGQPAANAPERRLTYTFEMDVTAADNDQISYLTYQLLILCDRLRSLPSQLLQHLPTGTVLGEPRERHYAGWRCVVKIEERE